MKTYLVFLKECKYIKKELVTHISEDFFNIYKKIYIMQYLLKSTNKISLQINNLQIQSTNLPICNKFTTHSSLIVVLQASTNYDFCSL